MSTNLEGNMSTDSYTFNSVTSWGVAHPPRPEFLSYKGWRPAESMRCLRYDTEEAMIWQLCFLTLNSILL